MALSTSAAELLDSEIASHSPTASTSAASGDDPATTPAPLNPAILPSITSPGPETPSMRVGFFASLRALEEASIVAQGEATSLANVNTRDDKGASRVETLIETAAVAPQQYIAPIIDEKRKSTMKTVTGQSKGPAAQSEVSVSLLQRLAGPSDQKAGLGIRDKEEVKRIIYEASSGSPYFRDMQKRDAELTKKVEVLQKKLEREMSLRKGDVSEEEKLVDAMIVKLETERDLSQTIIVVDADAFFASCEELKDPSLIGTAFVTGGASICTTASYEARKYGCRSAMATFVARKLCPHLRTVSSDHKLYSECSKKIMAVLGRFGPMTPASQDEAYCSVTQYCQDHNLTPAEVGEKMRAEVKAETGLSVSAGISPNCLISKIGADFNKPNGQYVVGPEVADSMAFMSALPIRKIPGIGRVGERWLQAMGVETVGDIYHLRGKLYLVREQIGLTFLLRAYLGLGKSTIEHHKREDRKSVGTERTFAVIHKVDDLHAKLRETAVHLASDLLHLEFSGRTLTLVLKRDTFERLSRASTLGDSVSTPDRIYREAKKLLDKEIAARAEKFDAGGKVEGSKGVRDLRLRLMGLRMTNLRDERESTAGPVKGSLQGWAKFEKKLTSQEILETWSAEDRAILKKAAHDDETSDSATAADEADADQDGLPGSSLPLWAQVGEEAQEEDESEGVNISREGVEEEEEKEETGVPRYRVPAFSAGPSLNSRLNMPTSALAPKADRIVFDPSSAASTSSLTADVLECPVCGVIFKGNVAGLSVHVNKCLESQIADPLIEYAAEDSDEVEIVSRPRIKRARQETKDAGKTAERKREKVKVVKPPGGTLDYFLKKR